MYGEFLSREDGVYAYEYEGEALKQAFPDQDVLFPFMHKAVALQDYRETHLKKKKAQPAAAQPVSDDDVGSGAEDQDDTDSED